jgi:glycine cleavage system H protein
MSEVRDDRQYTETHEWILDNGDGTYTMGISDHAQALLGDMVRNTHGIGAIAIV